MNKRKIGNIALWLTIIVIIGKAFGFLREVLLAYYFGTGTIVDAYTVSVAIPLILFGFLSAIGVNFTPYFFKTEQSKRNRILSMTLLTSIALSIICISITFALSRQIVTLSVGGFTDEAYKLTNSFLKITVFLVLLNTPIQLLIAYLNCNEHFILSNITNLLLSSIQCIFVILAAKLNIGLLPYGILVSYLVQFIILLIQSTKIGFRIEIDRNVIPNVRELIVSSVPICLSTVLVDINGFVDKYFSSFLLIGSVSALNYAYNVYSLFFYVATSAIVTIYFPRISEYFQKMQEDKICSTITTLLNSMMILLVPIMIICVLDSRNIIYIVLQRGRFDGESLRITSIPFMFYALGLPFIAIREVLIRLMYAMGDSKKNLLFGLIGVIVNIFGSAILVKFLDVGGLALATTLSSVITIPLYINRTKRFFEHTLKEYIVNLLKVVTSCLPMIAILLIENEIFPIVSFSVEVIKLIATYLISLSIAYIIMKKIKVEGIETIKKLISIKALFSRVK